MPHALYVDHSAIDETPQVQSCLCRCAHDDRVSTRVPIWHHYNAKQECSSDRSCFPSTSSRTRIPRWKLCHSRPRACDRCPYKPLPATLGEGAPLTPPPVQRNCPASTLHRQNFQSAP